LYAASSTRSCASAELSEAAAVSLENVLDAGARDSQSLRLNPEPLASLSLNISSPNSTLCDNESDQAENVKLSPYTAELSLAPQVQIYSTYLSNLMPELRWPTAAIQQLSCRHAQPTGNEIEESTEIAGSGACIFP
jgi:hypothetical protein